MTAAIYSNSPQSNSPVSFETDAHGIPQMPEDLKQYADLRLLDDAESLQQINDLAQEAYDLWKDNNFQQVKIIPEIDQPSPACYGVSPSEAVIFDADWPEPEDYDDDHEFEVEQSKTDIYVAAAKEKCFTCPLKAACLASSITHPVRGRDHQVDPDRVAYEPNGIWGGWGASAREKVYDQMVGVWQNEYKEGLID